MQTGSVRLIIYVFYCSILFFVGQLRAASAHTMQLTVHPHRDVYHTYCDQLQQLLPEQLAIERVTYTSDAYLQRDEFDYLFDIKPLDKVNADAFARALFFLIKKKKFEMIVLSFIPVGQQWHIHVDLYAFWTFNKLKFKGIFVGKEHLRQFYLMEHHDRFDEQKHADSIAKMQESFKADGYFQAEIKDTLHYNNQTKSVTVRIDLAKGPRFYIGDIHLQLQAPLLSLDERASLTRIVEHQLMLRLKKSAYIRENINVATKELKASLAAKGYMHSDIELDELVRYKQRRVGLVFKVTLHQKKKFCFAGNRFFSKEQLRSCLLAFGRSASLLPASILSEELVKLYHENGFRSVVISIDETSDMYTFTIDEGPRITINEVILRNVSEFDPAYLVKLFFSPLLKKKFYDAAVLEECIDQLMGYMLKQGFWQCALLHQSLVPITNHAYSLVLTIDEGMQTFLQRVAIPLYPHLENEGPFRAFTKDDAHIPFDVHFIEEQRQWLQAYFQKEGYYHAQVLPTFEREENNVSVTWDIVLNEHDELDAKTVVVGSTTFPFSFIKRELDYKIGDCWHKDTLRHAVSRLKKLEVFEAINLLPEKMEPDDPSSVMMLKLQKDDPYEVKMRTGLGIQHVTKSLSIEGLTYRVGGSFLYKNPTNTGDQFRIDADVTRSIRLANAQYRKPWLFGLPISALFKGYSNKFDYPGFIGSQRNLYTVIQQGFLMNYNMVYSVFDAALSTGFEVVDTYIDESTPEQACFAKEVARAINFRPDLLDKNIPFFLVQPTVLIYYLDSTVNPTKGSFSVLSLKGMFPMAKLEPSNFFIRILAEQAFFIPLWPFVCAIRFRVGHIFHQKFSTIIPIERFYLGGANSIRSYETDQCPPLGVVEDPCKDKCLYVPQGGRSLANLNLELRFPIYQQFGGVIFGDLGALSANRLTDIKADDLLSGIGVGLRYNTPIGPLRFDIAWRVHKRDGVGSPYAWFLSFGNAFI